MRFAGESFAPPEAGDFNEIAYSPQEKEEDKLLLRALQRGEIGSGPQVDKAIQDLINRINGVGQQVRGI